MKFAKWGSMIAAAAVLMGCATAEQKLADGGATQLSAAEVIQLMSDATYRVSGAGFDFVGYNRIGGSMIGRTTAGGSSETAGGVWSVNDEGLFCREWNNDWAGGEEGCFAIYNDGGQYVAVHRTGSVGSNPVSRYDSIEKGNTAGF